VKCLYLNRRAVVLGWKNRCPDDERKFKYIHTCTGFELGRHSVVTSDNNYSLEKYVRDEGRRPSEYQLPLEWSL
jgi:hypothetical protein